MGDFGAEEKAENGPYQKNSNLKIYIHNLPLNS
jgi:hypothetical protein